MTDDLIFEILRRIQTGIGELKRNLDALTEQVESLAHDVVEVRNGMRRLRATTVTYEDFNRLEARVAALEASQEDRH